MNKNQTYSKGDLPFAPGCQFKPRTIGNICSSNGHVFFFGGYVSLHLVLSGTGDISWCGRNRKLKPGDMFCILPDAKVSYTNTPDAPWGFCWVDIMGPAAEQIAHEAGFTVDELTRTNIPNKELLKDKFEFILALAAADENDPCAYARTILDILSLLRKPGGKHDRESDADAFEKLLRDPRNITMNINDFSAALHIDRTTLFHACKKAGMESPGKLLIRQKINYCRKLLLAYPDFTLKKIAAMSGFANEAYLCRAFKRECGCTPAEYRKEPDAPSGFTG